VPELGPLLAQALDFLVDLFESSHGGFNGRHAHGIPRQSSALPQEVLTRPAGAASGA
jgi:hypothetical protein